MKLQVQVPHEIKFIFSCKAPQLGKESLDPLLCWKDNEWISPSVDNMSKYILPNKATSVSSKSTFSVAGRLLSDVRSSVSDESVVSYILLHSWYNCRDQV